jgi:hypothetical protein
VNLIENGIELCPEETAQAKVSHQLMRDDIPCIVRRSDICGDKVDSPPPESTLRIPFGSEGKFITVLYDNEAGGIRKSFKQWLRHIFNSRAV